MSVKLLTEYHLEFLSLKGGCTGWSESSHVKMPHCWKSHVVAHLSSRPVFFQFLSGRFTQVLLYLFRCFQSTKGYGFINEPVHEVSNNVVCASSKSSDQPAHMRSLIRAFAGCVCIL